MKSIIVAVCFLFVGSLYGQKTNQPSLSKNMVETLVAAIQADPSLPSDHIVFINDYLCAEQDCTALFEGLPVKLYKKEGLFMRKIESYYALSKLTILAEEKKWQLSFSYLIKGGKASIPGKVTGHY